MKLVFLIRKSIEPYMILTPSISPQQRAVDTERMMELEKERQKRKEGTIPPSLLRQYPKLALILQIRPLSPSEEYVNNSRLPQR